MDIIDQLKLMEGGRTGPYPRDQTIREARETIERLRAAVEDAVETLEAMDMHIDNPLYARLRGALEQSASKED